MGESQNQKVDELLQKLKSLGARAKEARSSLGSPIADRLLDRLGKVSNRLPPGNNGHDPQQAQQAQQQPQEATISCPKCGTHALQGSHYCSACAFDYSEESQKQLRQKIEREALERSAKMGVASS
jgi:ribosomal protein L37E